MTRIGLALFSGPARPSCTLASRAHVVHWLCAWARSHPGLVLSSPIGRCFQVSLAELPSVALRADNGWQSQLEHHQRVEDGEGEHVKEKYGVFCKSNQPLGPDMTCMRYFCHVGC